jgi:putative SOS response-associated peptidase YedK
MCGRACLSSDVSEINLVFSIPPDRPTPNFAPSWNVAPTDPLPVVHYDARAGERSLDVMRWGLIPFWANDIKIGFSTFNARGEDVETKPGWGPYGGPGVPTYWVWGPSGGAFDYSFADWRGPDGGWGSP